jgi:hypothetical protein
MAQDPKLARALARLHSVRGYPPELDVPVDRLIRRRAQIRRLYRGYRRTSYSLRYTAAERRRGAEVIFFSDGLVVPKGTWPSQGARQVAILNPG